MSHNTEVARPLVLDQTTTEQSLEKIRTQTKELIARSKLQAAQSSRVSRYSAEVLADARSKRKP